MAHLRRAPPAVEPGALYASRVRVYPATVHGPMRRLKWAVLILCLAFYYALPWVRWDRGPGAPSQAVLLDLPNRRFHFFGLELWAQDITLLAGVMITATVLLFLATALFGRVWCGYACPQTVWTDLFMWVERLIEGDRNTRMRRDAQPPGFDAVWRKLAKHAAWLAIAFWTGGAWIMYYADAPTLVRQFWTGQADPAAYGFIALFTATTYLLAGWAREQVCTYMCPWPRFQSAMLDEQSLTVTYRAWRGEPRRRGKPLPPGPGVGDCVDCDACVAVCPTGVDIRDGIQLGCINCGLCIDACNHVMARVGRAPSLIAWDTLARQTAPQAKLRLVRPRSVIYAAVMLAALLGLGTALALRSTVEFSVQRDRAPMFVTLPDGTLRNGYRIRVVNKTAAALHGRLRLDGLAGAGLVVSESGAPPAEAVPVTIGADDVGEVRVFVTLDPALLRAPAQPVHFVLHTDGAGDWRTETVFMGPGGASR